MDNQSFNEQTFKQTQLETPAVNQSNIITIGSDSVLQTGAFRSPNYRKGQQGWSVDSYGKAEFQDISARVIATRQLFTASENITSGNAVSMGTGANYLLSSNSTGTTVIADLASGWMSQPFTTSSNAVTIPKISLRVDATTGSSGNVTVSIRADSAGLPTGSDINGITGTMSIVGGTVQTYTVTFPTAVPVSASTTYHVVFAPSGASIQQTKGDNTKTPKACTSSDGSTWITGSAMSIYEVYECDNVAGQICKSSASSTNTRLTFIGFADDSINKNDSGIVSISGLSINQSGLSVGSNYYCSDTLGAISTTPGTNTIKCGKAITSSQILITNIW